MIFVMSITYVNLQSHIRNMTTGRGSHSQNEVMEMNKTCLNIIWPKFGNPNQ